MTRPPPRSTLLPYTPLSRSRRPEAGADGGVAPPLRRERRPARRMAEGTARRGLPDRRGGPAARFGDAGDGARPRLARRRSEEHTSELQSRQYLVCRLLLEKK